MDYFTLMKERMEATHGITALQHPHPGIIGPSLTPAQAWASINPAFQNHAALAHITRDYSTPVTLTEERLTNEPQDMEVD